MITSYLTQLDELVDQHNFSLLDACLLAGVADSTYYRWRLGTSEPRLETATKIAHAVRGPKTADKDLSASH
jgi:transcriptional regulator with XRE-family HTH domain